MRLYDHPREAVRTELEVALLREGGALSLASSQVAPGPRERRPEPPGPSAAGEVHLRLYEGRQLVDQEELVVQAQ